MSTSEHLPPNPPNDPNKKLPEMSLAQLEAFETFMEKKEAEEEAEDAALKAEWKKEEVKKDALRIMSKIPLVLIVGYLIFQTFLATEQSSAEFYESQYDYKDSLQLYEEEIQTKIELQNAQLDVDPNTLGVSDGQGGSISSTTSNFEGPQLMIEALEFGGEVINLKKDPNFPGVEDFSITSLTFDPDHSKLGLPDLNVKISPVRLYKGPENDGKLQSVLNKIKDVLPDRGGPDKPKPYAVYTKDVILPDGEKQKMAMQLWLTEFDITVGSKAFVAKNKFIKEVQKNLEKKKEKRNKKKNKSKDGTAGQQSISPNKPLNDSIQASRDTIDTLTVSIRDKQLEIQDLTDQIADAVEDSTRLHKRINQLNQRKEGGKIKLFNWVKKNREKRKQKLIEERQEAILIVQQQDHCLRQDSSSKQDFHPKSKTCLKQLEQELEDLGADLKKEEANLKALQRRIKEEVTEAYPAHWYPKGGKSSEIPIEELPAETDNQRYENLKIWFKVDPNAGPWYVKDKNGQNVTPKMAVGAIYCTQVKNDVINDKPDYALDPQTPTMNVNPGIAVAMYERMVYQSAIGQGNQVQEVKDMESSTYYFQEPDEGSIWDKPYYMKIFLKDVGSHKQRNWFKGKKFSQYDDQYTFSFVMPLLVRGSWNVIPPQEIIPDWDPPTPRRVAAFRFADLLPNLGIPFLGRGASLIILVIAGLFILNFFFPGFKDILVLLTNLLRDTIITSINWIKGLFSRKKT